MCPKCFKRHRLLDDESIDKYQKFEKQVWASQIYDYRLDQYDNNFYVTGSDWAEKQIKEDSYQGFPLRRSGFKNI